MNSVCRYASLFTWIYREWLSSFGG